MPSVYINFLHVVTGTSTNSPHLLKDHLESATCYLVLLSSLPRFFSVIDFLFTVKNLSDLHPRFLSEPTTVSQPEDQCQPASLHRYSMLCHSTNLIYSCYIILVMANQTTSRIYIKTRHDLTLMTLIFVIRLYLMCHHRFSILLSFLFLVIHNIPAAFLSLRRVELTFS